MAFRVLRLGVLGLLSSLLNSSLVMQPVGEVRGQELHLGLVLRSPTNERTCSSCFVAR